MKARISCAKNGPLLVAGVDDLTSLDGKTRYPAEKNMALCRCGKSANKPFCDGTHAQVGFDDSKHEDRMRDRRVDYQGRRITIHDNRGICAHAAICTDRLAAVFRHGQKPWIDPDGATVDEIVAIIEACPSGALDYSIDGVEQTPDYSGEPAIRIAPGGPYAIKGSVELDGVEWGEGARKDCFDLCRCGQSKNKPFCDGSHWYTEFDEHAKAEE